ncbi:MAG: DUF6526 family protein [Ferruginibacter sp.]
MKEQNFSNHSKYVPLFHFATSSFIGLGLTGAIVNLVRACNHESGRLAGTVLVLVFIIAGLFFWYIRAFSLGAQDRAIRAEENLRYFSIKGKLLDNRLTMRQIIALRFAPDDELVELSDRAVKENLKPTDIKQAIQQWKADHDRI